MDISETKILNSLRLHMCGRPTVGFVQQKFDFAGFLMILISSDYTPKPSISTFPVGDPVRTLIYQQSNQVFYLSFFSVFPVVVPSGHFVYYLGVFYQSSQGDMSSNTSRDFKEAITKSLHKEILL